MTLSTCTHLKDNILLWDGKILVDIKSEPDKLNELLINGLSPSQIVVTELTPEIQQFNKLNYASDKIIDINNYQFELDKIEYIIPNKYKQMDLYQYLDNVLIPKIENDEYYDIRLDRLLLEIKYFIDNNLDDLIRTIIYMIDVLNANNIVWGVGRGSACASYLLYLLDLHMVDPIKYNIDIHEFFHE